MSFSWPTVLTGLHCILEHVLGSNTCAADQAHLSSPSGGASYVLCGCPTAPEFRITPLVIRTIVCLADTVHL